VVAAGGVVYSWLPSSPGYNDVVLLGALLGLAAVLAMDRHAERAGRGAVRLPFWLPFAFGAAFVPVLLAKWAALLLLALVALAGVIALAPLGPRAVAGGGGGGRARGPA